MGIGHYPCFNLMVSILKMDSRLKLTGAAKNLRKTLKPRVNFGVISSVIFLYAMIITSHWKASEFDLLD